MITVVFCVRKRPELSDEEFRRYWWEDHGPLVKKHAKALRIHRYAQMPRIMSAALDGMATVRGAPEPYDGVAQVSWTSMEELQASFDDPDARRAGRELIEDEKRFIDLANSPIFFTEEKVVVGERR